MAALFSTVLTPEGMGIVIGINLSGDSCIVQLFYSGKLLRLPLSDVSEVSAV